MNIYQTKNINYNIPRCFPSLRCLCRLRALTFSLFFVVVPSFIPVLNIYLSYAIEEQHATIASITAAAANEQISRHKQLLSVDFVLSLTFLIHTDIFKCKAQLDMDKENLHRTNTRGKLSSFSNGRKRIICVVTLKIFFSLIAYFQ